ncbi:hypothetical protein LCGC14_2435330 [marine sediment metagenome]|uniref:Uncharacterized protein n=1 Tax=marine sediment metagenome TaxID=412755 RepID=A0A0F9BKM2_9ZZZZ
MSKPKTCIRITGTRTGKLRARVEHKEIRAEPHINEDGELRLIKKAKSRFDVTIGGQKWYGLELQLRLSILCRARDYVNQLDKGLVEAIHEFEAFEQSEGIHTELDWETLGLREETCR